MRTVKIMKPLPILHSTFSNPHIHPDRKDYWKCVAVCRLLPMLVILFCAVLYLLVPTRGHEQLGYFRWAGENGDFCTKDLLRTEMMKECPW